MTKYLDTGFDLNAAHLIEVIDELPLWSAPFGLKLLEKIRYKKNISVLDIGFGTGFPLTELAMRLGDTCKVYGIDPWKAATERVRKKLKMYGIKNVEIIEGVAEQIPLLDRSIDLIVSNNGTNNVVDMDQVFAECSRVMSTGGQFLQTVNLETTMIEFYDILAQVLKGKNMNKALPALKQHIYQKRKPLQEITDSLQTKQFRISRIEHESFEYIFTDGTSMLRHYFIRLAFLEGWKGIIPNNRQAEIFGEVEQVINEKASDAGSFRLTIPFVLIDCEKI